ncbi:hypothetical protein COCON_G00164050 [Conger conger]|uniref:General transcription factor 3C polypeptide 4 n=1 Tax=Conger conger TaxID=82655 RepID=A0A9Q1D6F3_CONCO|nr:hypothetical protein COCON_G00164050 [Conger conger]
MAASSTDHAADRGEAEPEPDTSVLAGHAPIVKREPEVKLLSPASGMEPLSCYSRDMVIHRTSIPVPEDVCVLQVGPEQEVLEAKEKLASSRDPAVSQVFKLDRSMNPTTGTLPPMRGTKYTCWSPLGCDTNGRCLLACLTLDSRLTVHSNTSRLQLELLPPAGRLEDLAELQRRHHMQAPVRMEWSSVCATQQVQTNNECKDVGTVLLAVLMENGDLVVWQFGLPFLGGESVVSCSTIRSGVSAPSVLAWWEYEHGGRKMSGLIVGSLVGPVKILPVNLKAVKGYFTLRQPVKCSCSLVVAARGPYLFWCLLLISKAGLNVHNSHVTGLHSAPITSMAAGRHGGAVFTYASDGALKKLTPIFTDLAVTFRQEEVELPEGVAGMRTHGLALSPNGAYLAVFVTLKTPDGAAAELLESRVQSLFRQADLLDLVRWKVLQDKRIPPLLQDELDDKVHTTGNTYLWRFKLFLFRVLYQSLQKAPAQARRRHEEVKAFIVGEEAEEEEVEGRMEGQEGEVSEEQVGEITAWIEAMETHLTREHMKRVLGQVYLHTWITENTSIPTRGVCDFLTSDTTYEDRAAKVLIGHIFKKMNKQTFPEYCSLCKEVLPFTDRKQAVCSNGHIWLRCVLTYQACQSLNYRRCLLLDSIARHPVPEDWVLVWLWPGSCRVLAWVILPSWTEWDAVKSSPHPPHHINVIADVGNEHTFPAPHRIPYGHNETHRLLLVAYSHGVLGSSLLVLESRRVCSGPHSWSWRATGHAGVLTPGPGELQGVLTPTPSPQPPPQRPGDGGRAFARTLIKGVINEGHAPPAAAAGELSWEPREGSGHGSAERLLSVTDPRNWEAEGSPHDGSNFPNAPGPLPAFRKPRAARTTDRTSQTLLALSLPLGSRGQLARRIELPKRSRALPGGAGSDIAAPAVQFRGEGEFDGEWSREWGKGWRVGVARRTLTSVPRSQMSSIIPPHLTVGHLSDSAIRSLRGLAWGRGFRPVIRAGDLIGRGAGVEGIFGEAHRVPLVCTASLAELPADLRSAFTQNALQSVQGGPFQFPCRRQPPCLVDTLTENRVPDDILLDLMQDGSNGLGDGSAGCFRGHAGPPRPAALPGAALPTQAGELTGAETRDLPQDPPKNAHLPPAGGVLRPRNHALNTGSPTNFPPPQ